ncbi:MAG: type II toxin-antitoxin system VapC family toxin [Candidatus Riflebacteria bacterium]|nr:type II toxin-antitoxin system VapC family toxin [Candidatus Riflebacteria bacterium]
MRLRIYLDVCCLNRPFDNQENEIIRLEAEAVRMIIRALRQGTYDWVSSHAVEYEVARTPSPERRALLTALLGEAHAMAPFTGRLVRKARTLQGLGLHRLDALHLAFAETAGAKVFLTTDRRILRFAEREGTVISLAVRNPVSWLLEVEDE